MERILSDLLDWRLQFKDYKTLIITGSTAEDRTQVLKDFALKNFENMIHINLKNNEKIREYINTMPPGYDAYLFLEKTLIDIIIPVDTMLIFDNADSCDHEAVFHYAEDLFSEDDMCFLAISGDFTDEELAPYEESCIHLRLPSAE